MFVYITDAATLAQRKVTAPISCEQIVITFYTCITWVKVTATAEMSCRLLVFCKLWVYGKLCVYEVQHSY